MVICSIKSRKSVLQNKAKRLGLSVSGKTKQQLCNSIRKSLSPKRKSKSQRRSQRRSQRKSQRRSQRRSQRKSLRKMNYGLYDFLGADQGKSYDCKSLSPELCVTDAHCQKTVKGCRAAPYLRKGYFRKTFGPMMKPLDAPMDEIDRFL